VAVRFCEQQPDGEDAALLEASFFSLRHQARTRIPWDSVMLATGRSRRSGPAGR